MDRRRLVGFTHTMRGHTEAGRSPDEQARLLEVWADRNGVELIGVWHGSSMDRGRLAAALAHCVQGSAEGLVVECMDRLGDLIQQECLLDMMLRRGWSLWSTDEWEQRVLWGMEQDPQRELMRETIQRVRRVDTTLRRVERLTKGQPQPAPYGYKRVGGVLELHPDEAPIVAWILELKATGLGYYEIMRVLDKAGVKPRKARKWSYETVRRVCERDHPLLEQVLHPDVAHEVVQ